MADIAHTEKYMQVADDNSLGDELLSWDGEGARIALYSHDTLGLGHLRRTQKICRALIAQAPKLSVLVITGSPHAAISDFPSGVDFVKLPTVKKKGAEKYKSRYLTSSFERTLAMRTEIITSCLATFSPDLFLVDHAPHGMRGEILNGLRLCKDQKTKCILGLRDVLDSSERVKKLWSDEGIYTTLAESYDRILIYGQQNVYDPTEEYAFPAALREKTTFCGYITDTFKVAPQPTPSGARPERPKVVVTIGGGDYYVEEVIGAFFAGLEKQNDAIPFDSEVYCGAYLAPERLQEFKTRSEKLPVQTHGYQKNLHEALVSCDLVVGTGGYNTVTEALALAPRALIIPRVTMRDEQTLRAERLSRRGALRWLSADTLTPELLYNEIAATVASDERPLTEARAIGAFELDGATRAAKQLTFELHSALSNRTVK